MDDQPSGERRRRRYFSPEFKARTVELIRQSGKTILEVCRDLDLSETAVRRWVAQIEVDEGSRAGLSTDERAELARLRRENNVLREEREILKCGYGRSPGCASCARRLRRWSPCWK